MEAWYPGIEGGNAIANIIFGEINPSGKLPITFPKKLSDSPAHMSQRTFPGDEKGKPSTHPKFFVIQDIRDKIEFHKRDIRLLSKKIDLLLKFNFLSFLEYLGNWVSPHFSNLPMFHSSSL